MESLDDSRAYISERSVYQRLQQSNLWSWPMKVITSFHTFLKKPLRRKSCRHSDVQVVARDEEEAMGDRGSEKEKTIFYLAYGSNLSKETFRGKRGINPLSAVNVCVPSLRLTFDLPGIPYAEPCFANTARRDPGSSQSSDENVLPVNGAPRINPPELTEKSPLLPDMVPNPDYHKDRWHKPLVGVVYELTHKDYARVIQTEGGGSSYTDITVPCYPLEKDVETVPSNPTNTPIESHTLFAPAKPSPKPGNPSTCPNTDNSDDKNPGRFRRPDPSYAQPSPRYLKLITDGASEHSLPSEYQQYLSEIRPYKPTSQKQRLGKFIFLSLWAPIVLSIFSVSGFFADENGRLPEWLGGLTKAIFRAVWGSYDGGFMRMFGDGERTTTKND